MKKLLLLFICFHFLFSLNSVAQCNLQRKPQEKVNIKPYCGVDTDVATKFKVYYSVAGDLTRMLRLSFVKSGEDFFVYLKVGMKTSEIDFHTKDPLVLEFKKREDTLNLFLCKKKSIKGLSDITYGEAWPVMVYRISKDKLQLIANNKVRYFRIKGETKSGYNSFWYSIKGSYQGKLSAAASCILSQ